MTDTMVDAAPASQPAPATAITLGVEGDTSTTWDPTDANAVVEAQNHFNAMRDRGWLAYTINPENREEREQVRDFPATAGLVMYVPATAGG